MASAFWAFFFPWSHPTTEMNITLDKGHITPLPVHPLNFPPPYNFQWHSTYRFSTLPSGIFPLSLPHHFVLGVFNGGCRHWQILPILNLMQEFHFFDKLQWLVLLSFLKRKTLDPIRCTGTCITSLDLSVSLKCRRLIFFQAADWSLCFTNHVACISTKQDNSTTI